MKFVSIKGRHGYWSLLINLEELLTCEEIASSTGPIYRLTFKGGLIKDIHSESQDTMKALYDAVQLVTINSDAKEV